ncbi:MAG: MarR family transcriptional regulator [Verrucomicrobiota bacterium]
MSKGLSTSIGPPLTQADYQALAAFRHRLRMFLRFSEEAAAREGLSAQQHQTLLAIHGYPEGRGSVTIGALAERLQLRHHSVVGLVNRLELDGLLIRQPSAEDRRRVGVILSQRGLELLHRLSSSHRQELRRHAPALRELLQQIEQE